MQGLSYCSRYLVTGSRYGSRAYSTFTFKELASIAPISQILVGPTSGEHLTGPAQRLFKQLSSFEDAVEMFRLVDMGKELFLIFNAIWGQFGKDT